MLLFESHVTCLPGGGRGPIFAATLGERTWAPASARATACFVCRNGEFRLVRKYSNNLKIPLQLPVRHPIQPLPPFPLARRGEVIDEIIAQPITRDL